LPDKPIAPYRTNDIATGYIRQKREILPQKSTLAFQKWLVYLYMRN